MLRNLFPVLDPGVPRVGSRFVHQEELEEYVEAEEHINRVVQIFEPPAATCPSCLKIVWLKKGVFD